MPNSEDFVTATAGYHGVVCGMKCMLLLQICVSNLSKIAIKKEISYKNGNYQTFPKKKEIVENFMEQIQHLKVLLVIPIFIELNINKFVVSYCVPGMRIRVNCIFVMNITSQHNNDDDDVLDDDTDIVWTIMLESVCTCRLSLTRLELLSASSKQAQLMKLITTDDTKF
ncbi:hypothetical protein FF38_05963 [Lucilia cuprina]|uniref:Uncharacterized protein n=1 Tax=Lucilia cuprina TaxID=7375 RepID=A0A0L0CSA4_LUCCU|nr:hypothetical protein FF38_05963 [Lucilia cuprina]